MLYCPAMPEVLFQLWYRYTLKTSLFNYSNHLKEL